MTTLLDQLRENIRSQEQNHLVHLKPRDQKRQVNDVINSMNNLELVKALSRALEDLEIRKEEALADVE